MASIFLSYARDDTPKAKALAKCLERAGHSVWWDRHIHGGSDFADEIETALRAAEVIVVLWSATSLKSAWVRDEAAEGRDSGRLVPIQVDDSAPPLGFRQFQSIPITGWSGRGNPPDFAAIKAAIDRITGARPDPEIGRTDTSVRKRMGLAAIAGVVALFIAAAVGLFLMKGGAAKAEAPVIAVLPFSDLSPQGDRAYLAEGVAEAILTVLAKEPGIKVIGRSSARQLHDAGAAAAEMRKAMGITHVLEGSARSAGDQLRMSVRLVDASDGRQLWAEEYQRQLDNIFAVQDEIGRSVAERLRGSFGGTVTATPITKADIYALYLAARSKIRDRRTSALEDALQLTRRVMTADPDYAPAHALYAEIINHLSVDNYGTIPTQQSRQIAQRHARKAIQLAPSIADGYAAFGLVSEGEPAISALQRAIKLDPARAEVRHWLGHALNDVGRKQEALAQFEATLEMEPLWGPAVSMVAYTYAASERYEEAEEALDRFEKRGGKSSIANKIRGDIGNYRGDYSEAVRLTEIALRQDPETPQADLSAGWFYFMLGMSEDALRVSGRLPRNLRLLFSGERERLLNETRAAGANLFKQEYPEVGVNALASARAWGEIVKLYDVNRNWSEKLCRNPEMFITGIQIAVALKYQGRPKESTAFLACLRRTLMVHGRGPVFSPYLSAGGADLTWAQIHAIEGNSDEAFRMLERAIDRGMRTPYGRGLDHVEGFEPYTRHPAYAPADMRLRRLIAQDRAETLSWKRRAA